MKKTLMLGLLGVALSSASSFAQGVVFLDNYNTGGPNIVYGAGAGGTQGSAVGAAGWTVGLYYAPGSVLGATAGNDVPGGPFVLGTGVGSTAVLAGPTTGSTAGQFLASGVFLIDPVGAAGATFTIQVVAYNGANYANSTIRGHSAAFTMTTSSSSAPTPNAVGSFMQGFSVLPVAVVPEPTTLALAGLGGMAFLVSRRRKA